jgi:pyruvate formate lyase activating enzyme
MEGQGYKYLEKAILFNIMRYSVHDGPGIRTTVFFKGCPLSCKWCHNPESINPQPQQVFDKNKCIKCGHCASVSTCPSAKESDICPTGARETIGYEITVPQLMDEINKDLLFYEQSGGGVTFSGGEPFYQGEFLLEVLAQCRDDYINTAIDTSGFCETDIMLKTASMSNYILFDIKFIDATKHNQYCGVPNELILHNLKCLSKINVKLLIRIPVIPTINDDMQEMTSIFEFLKTINNIEAIHLLPYHNFHVNKYKKTGIQYELSEISSEQSPNMDTIYKLFSNRYKTKIGG